MAILTRVFNGAQVFYVDSAIANGAPTVDLTSIDLYFKFKPSVDLNLTGTTKPGVSVFHAQTRYGIPLITRESKIFTGEIARLPLDQIYTSSDATVPTTFRFPEPIPMETDKEHCFVYIFEQLAQYELWTSKQGEILTGTTSISPGPSDKFIGRYFGFTSVFAPENNTNLDEYQKFWRAIPDTSLKFTARMARYAHGGVPVWSNGSISNDDIIQTNPETQVVANSTSLGFNVNYGSYEYVSFNESKSNKSVTVGKQSVFQNTVLYPGGENPLNLIVNQGNSTVTANTQLPNGEIFQWSNIFTTNNPRNAFVITDGSGNYNVRGVQSIVSNTVLTVNEPITFSSSAARMMVTATGKVASFNKASPFGVDDAFLMIDESTANSSVRFVNNDVESVSIVAGGSGYDNSDIIYVTGFEQVTNKVEGGYIAVANVVTNSTGGITNVYFSNLGCGFVNTSLITTVYANSSSGNTTGNTSAGTGADLSYTIGSTIITEFGNNKFLECVVRNLDIGEFIPFSRLHVPTGQPFSFKLETNYVKEADSGTFDGFAYYVNDGVNNNQLQINMYERNSTEELAETPVTVSKSNEYALVYKNGTANDKLPTANASSETSESIRIITDIDYTQNDWATVLMDPPFIQFSKYIINNDYTDEHTDSGNAIAKGITKVVEFDRTAEDIRVYLTQYTPANTDIKVYARIFKNEDPEAFDDKDWTLLELKDGYEVKSSLADPLDYIERTYGFYQVPPDRTEIAGTIQLQSGNNVVVGTNTAFDTDLANGDLVYLYQPLFVDNHVVVSVESVTNSSQFVMDFSTTNTSILAEGMKMEKITYPNQAFNNKQNSNLVKYYNSTSAGFDGYESVAVKLVFLSDSPHKIPRIDDMKGVGVSA